MCDGNRGCGGAAVGAMQWAGGHLMSGSELDPLGGIAEVLAGGEPCTWRRLLSEHVVDGRGNCRSCRRSSGLAAKWPCILRMIAEEAQRLTTVEAARSRPASGRPGLNRT